MTQEFINKHIADICHYLGHPALERNGDGLNAMGFMNAVSWCMDVCGAPRSGIGFFVLNMQEWIEFNEWLVRYGLYDKRCSLYPNARIFNYNEYEFTIVRKIE